MCHGINGVFEKPRNSADFCGTLCKRYEKEKSPANRATALILLGKGWLRGQDSNLRPSGYEPDKRSRWVHTGPLLRANWILRFLTGLPSQRKRCCVVTGPPGPPAPADAPAGPSGVEAPRSPRCQAQGGLKMSITPKTHEHSGTKKSPKPRGVRSPPRTPLRGRRSFDWTSRAKEALLWGNGPEGRTSGPPAPTG